MCGPTICRFARGKLAGSPGWTDGGDGCEWVLPQPRKIEGPAIFSSSQHYEVWAKIVNRYLQPTRRFGDRLPSASGGSPFLPIRGWLPGDPHRIPSAQDLRACQLNEQKEARQIAPGMETTQREVGDQLIL